jgi:hypothetical protein
MAKKHGHNVPHTVTNRGKRVAIGLKNGQLVIGKFIRRAANNRWVEVQDCTTTSDESSFMDYQKGVTRIQRAEIQSFSVIKGELSLKRLGRKK